MGLPNDGFDALEKKCKSGQINPRNKIISIAAWNTSDWMELLARAAALQPLAVEMNVSCPNTPGELDITGWYTVYMTAAALPVEVYVKLPPINYEYHLNQSALCGLRSYHCCNTQWTPGGGMSGAPLRPLVLACVRAVIARVSEPRIIAGGGVSNLEDVKEYRRAGARHVAVGSACFNIFRWSQLRAMARELYDNTSI